MSFFKRRHLNLRLDYARSLKCLVINGVSSKCSSIEFSEAVRTICRMYARKQHERAEIMKEHQAVLREYKKREASLLSNSLQVKCLTDLIVLEQKVCMRNIDYVLYFMGTIW